MPRTTPVSFEKFIKPMEGVMRWSIPLLFFLTPLALLPWTSEALEINKQVVFVVLTFLASLGLVGEIVSKRQIRVRGGWLVNIVPLAFLAATLVSTILSIGGVQSWLGYGSQEYLSFLTAAAGVLLFYVLINGSDTALAKRSLFALLLSASLASLITLLSLANVNVIPFAFADFRGFNTVGNINALAAWLIPVSIIGLGMYLVDESEQASAMPTGAAGMLTKLMIAFVTIAAMIFLVAIDFWQLWAALMVGLMALVFISFLEPKHFPNLRRLLVPGLLFLTALVFLFVKTPMKLPISLVVSPSLSTSWQITKSTLQEGGSKFLFGSGPGTFALDYAKYHPQVINETIFWNRRFDRALIHPLTVLSTTGAVGLVTWLSVILVVIAMGLGRIVRDRQAVEWKVNYALLAGWMSLFVLQLVSPANMTLTVMFWGLSGLLVAEAVAYSKVMNFSEAPKAALGITSGAAIFVVLGCLSLFALMSRQGGDIAYAKALRLDANNGDLNEIVRQLNRATSRDGANPIYHRTLAAAYLAQASSGSATDSADGDFSPEDTQRLANFANLAIQSANKAVQVGESDAANWASAGVIYRELMPVVQNSQNFAVNTLAQAVLLEPGNPAYMTDLGRVYLAVADRAQAVQDLADVSEDVKAQASANEVEHLRVAEEKFTKALELKSDYALANYYLAATFERQGKLDEATDRLSALTKVQPNDTGLGFQLGVIQIKRNDLDAASAEFERVLNIYPNYSNAMWYLAAIKANKGDAAGAITLLNKVLELNPDSQVVKDSIRNLEVGGSTPVEPAPIADGQVDTNTTP